MNVEEIMTEGLVFGKGKGVSAFSNSAPPKKKLSGSQKMRAEYKARKAAESKKRAEKQQARK